MEISTLQAWWAHRQGLDGFLAGRSAAEALAWTGWARLIGGAGPYLTLFARAGLSRESVDAAVARLEIHELPSARGCTYVVPAVDFAIALRAGQGFGEASEMRVAEKFGVTVKEIDRLCQKVIDSLAQGPKAPEELREAAGGAVRRFGEEGKKKGLTTTLPIALGMLQSAGEIRRTPTNGRLDQQRYRCTLWRPSPLAKFTLSAEEVHVELARRYFRWIGPASLAEFQWFSGLGVKAAKAAVASLKLKPAPDAEDRLMFPEDCEALRTFKTPEKPRIALVSSVDGLTLLRRNLKTLIAPQDLPRKVLVETTSNPLAA